MWRRRGLVFPLLVVGAISALPASAFAYEYEVGSMDLPPCTRMTDSGNKWCDNQLLGGICNYNDTIESARQVVHLVIHYENPVDIGRYNALASCSATAVGTGVAAIITGGMQAFIDSTAQCMSNSGYGSGQLEAHEAIECLWGGVGPHDYNVPPDFGSTQASRQTQPTGPATGTPIQCPDGMRGVCIQGIPPPPPSALGPQTGPTIR